MLFSSVVEVSEVPFLQYNGTVTFVGSQYQFVPHIISFVCLVCSRVVVLLLKTGLPNEKGTNIQTWVILPSSVSFSPWCAELREARIKTNEAALIMTPKSFCFLGAVTFFIIKETFRWKIRLAEIIKFKWEYQLSHSQLHDRFEK